LFLPTVVSLSSPIGLEGPGASLLGCGVRAAGSFGLVKDSFRRPGVGVFFAGVVAEGAGLGESVAFLKKPIIDLWVFPWEPEAGVFFCDDGLGVDIALPSWPRAIVTGNQC
jgi:hypothetical protein